MNKKSNSKIKPINNLKITLIQQKTTKNKKTNL